MAWEVNITLTHAGKDQYVNIISTHVVKDQYDA